MSDPFDEMVDDVFDELAIDALYKSGGAGAGVTVRVRSGNPDLLIPVSGLNVVGASTILRVRVSQVLVVAKGDVFVIGAVDHKVIGEPRRDNGRRLWIAGAVEA